VKPAPFRCRISVATALLCLLPAIGWSQSYPSRPLRFIVGFAPGGVADIMARALGLRLTEALGQPVIIDNRTGAGGTISMQITAQAPPDGHTLLLASSTQFSITPALRAKLPYDPIKDYTPVTHVALTPVIFSVPAASPARTVPEFIQYARARSGRSLTYGSPGYGGAPHIAGELFKRVTGIAMNHVPYKGGPPVATALLGGEIDMAFGAVSTYLPHVKSGRLRSLAVTSPRRLAAMPDVPTFIDTGLTELEVVQWFGVFAPAGQSAAVTRRLHEILTQAIESPQLKAQFAAQGVEFISSSPQDLAAYVKTELIRWGKIVKDLGITDQP